MATEKQVTAARQNIKKAQAKWRSMSHRQHSISQPEGHDRAKPGEKGTGEYYRVVLRDSHQFTSFRNQDVGKPGGLQRIAGHRRSGSWDTQAWLVSKDDAHVSGMQLIPDSRDAKELFETLSSKPVHEKGDVFRARDRRNVAEREKPTEAQRRAWSENIKKAQAARHRN